VAPVVICVPKETSDVCSSTGTWLPNLHISSRGTLSAHNAVFLTESDIISLLCMVTHGITNKSPRKVFLRYSLASPVVDRPCTCLWNHRYRLLTDFWQMWGRSACVDAHLPTVDEGFRTYRHWRTYSIYRIEADDAITWKHSLSRFGRTRCRRARSSWHALFHNSVFALRLWSAPKFRKF